MNIEQIPSEQTPSGSASKVAIVDPYSSGLELARQFKARVKECWMVRSSDTIPGMYRSFARADQFDGIVNHRGSLDETCAELRSHNIGHVITGCEMGVELADQIAARLGLVCNGTRLTEARRNKALMLDTLQHSGVRIPRGCCCYDLTSLSAWLRDHGQWPVVLKPFRGSASHNVLQCDNESEAESAFHRIIDQQGPFGETNSGVLAQEYLRGTEYAVDTVSCRGQHVIAAIWRYGRWPPDEEVFGSDSFELLPHSRSLEHKLFPYVSRVLEALEITTGPAHCELMLDQDGPVVIELGARLHGGNNPMLSRYGGGDSQIDLTVESYLEPDRFLRRVGEPYHLDRHAMRVFLMPPERGRLKSPPNFEAIERLDSFHKLRFSAQPGQQLARIAGWVVLVHPDASVLQRDRDAIRRFEQEGLFVIDSV